MEHNKHVPSGDADHELEAQILTVVKKIIPVLRVAKNTTKVLRRLSFVGADTFVAALEAGTSWFRLAKARNEHIIAQLAELPSEQSAIGVKVAARLLEEQSRIDQLVFEAIEHVQASDHSVLSEEGKDDERKDEIDDDWIESFRREAADRSQGEMRETFVRILAGEIREPGAFSIKTLRTVGALSQSTAKLFRKAASLRVSMEIIASANVSPRLLVLDARVPSLGGDLDQNYLQDEGLGYNCLIKLTENGLLHPVYDSWQTYDLVIPSPQLNGRAAAHLFHQDQKWELIPLPDFKARESLKIHGAKFTTVGQELLHIVDIESDAAFLNKVRTYLKSQHVEMVTLSSSTT